jgi:methenyltetrahydromethanopterin cyclohydrolase
MNPAVNDMFAALGGTNRLSAMIGAKHLSFSDKDKPYITFKHIPSGCSTNYFKMTLNGLDLYDLEFIRVRANKVTVVKSVENVYASDVRRIFEETTGLYLTL